MRSVHISHAISSLFMVRRITYIAGITGEKKDASIVFVLLRKPAQRLRFRGQRQRRQ